MYSSSSDINFVKENILIISVIKLLISKSISQREAASLV